MGKYKKWSFFVLVYLIAFVGFNFLMWKLVTEDLLTNNRFHNGGLDRLGYIIGVKTYRNAETSLPDRAIENWEYQGGSVDILTIGDSFSNVKNNGRDPLYQDWLASLYGYTVLNVQPLQGHDPFSSLIVLLNSGYLEKIRARAVILQIVERNCVEVLTSPADFAETMALAEIEAYYRTARFKDIIPEVSFINTGNFKVLRNWVLYHYSDNAIDSPVFMVNLEMPLFKVKNDKKLLFYQDDILHIKNATPEAIDRLNGNLNALAALLAKKKIRLCFLPAADKYNVYSKFIVKNPYPLSRFFELLRPLDKDYAWIDTKVLLTAEAEKGEKDIYYSDDSHWSWKAVKKIAEHMECL